MEALMINTTLIDNIVSNISAVVEEAEEKNDDVQFVFSSKFIILSCIQRFSSILSILGSTSIIYSLLKQHKMLCFTRSGKSATTASYILLCISTCDFLSSFFGGLNSAMVQKDLVWQSYGNDFTCNLQGFMFHTFSTMGGGYNVMQALYFVCKVCYGFKEYQFQKKTLQFLFLYFPFILVFGFNMWPLYDKSFNYSNRTNCSYEPYPLNCKKNGVPCTRGIHADTIRFCATIFTMCCAVIIICAVLKLFLSVLDTERALDKYTIEHPNQNHQDQQEVEEGKDVLSSSMRDESSSSKQKEEGKDALSLPMRDKLLLSRQNAFEVSNIQRGKRKRSARVAKQGIFYAGCFLITYFVWFIFCIRKFMNLSQPYFLLVGIHFFFPLQGFLNAFVYYRQNKNNLPEFVKSAISRDKSAIPSQKLSNPMFSLTSPFKQSSFRRSAVLSNGEDGMRNVGESELNKNYNDATKEEETEEEEP